MSRSVYRKVIKGDSDSVIHIIQSILPIKTDTSLRHGQSGPVPKVSILGLFPFVRTGWPDHCSTSQFENKIGFFQEFLPKNHLLLAYCSGFDWSGWRVFIKREIIIAKRMVCPVSSDKWKAPLEKVDCTF